MRGSILGINTLQGIPMATLLHGGYPPFPYSIVLKANPYRDKYGRFTNKANAASVANWAEHGSKKKLDAILSDPVKAKALFDKEHAELKSAGLAVSPYFTHDDFLNHVGGKVSLKDFVQSMVGRTKDLDKIRLSGGLDGVKVSIYPPAEVHGDKALSFSRTFKKNHEVHHDLWVLDEKARGSGGVKRGIRSMMDFYKRADMKEVSVYANIDAGSYAWAKFGFLPKDRGALNDVQGIAMQRLKKVGEKGPSGAWYKPPKHLTPDEAAAYSGETQQLKKILDSDSKFALQALSDLKTPMMDKVFKPTVSTNAYTGGSEQKAVSFVGMLMNGNSWDGVFDLNDKAQLRRMKQYSGGKPLQNSGGAKALDPKNTMKY